MNIFSARATDRPPRAGVTPDSRSRGRSDARLARASGEEKVWHTRDAILLCIGHNTGSEKLVRTAARLASRLGSVWHAVYVETPTLHRLPEKQRRLF
ncbi:sensor protein KdpD [Salmonella enterica subsp. enterica]|uniref:Sensor protein KdpD n=1 Tax=Salmonella enterica I TaxID=59201 RepID=A0A379WXD0_SALET|nr:sensor protein KdpD [Salmonella enterica subsp. enterica]